MIASAILEFAVPVTLQRETQRLNVDKTDYTTGLTSPQSAMASVQPPGAALRNEVSGEAWSRTRVFYIHQAGITIDTAPDFINYQGGSWKVTSFDIWPEYISCTAEREDA